MKNTTFMTLFLTLTILSCNKKKATTETLLDQLDGTWTGCRYDDGDTEEDESDDGSQYYEIIFDGDEMTVNLDAYPNGDTTCSTTPFLSIHRVANISIPDETLDEGYPLDQEITTFQIAAGVSDFFPNITEITGEADPELNTFYEITNEEAFGVVAGMTLYGAIDLDGDTLRISDSDEDDENNGSTADKRENEFAADFELSQD